MVRRIIQIDEEKCNGCGLCANACHEGAIGVTGGKAKLLRDDYCDGLGDCLPACPVDAIHFVEREAADYDREAVAANQKKKAGPVQPVPVASSQLRQWPVQIKLVAVNAPFLEGADLLIAADCTAYAYGNFHQEFMHGRVTLVGCPKLDDGDYSEKLTQIIRQNHIRSVTVVRMEVPCCAGIEHAAMTALENSGKRIPWQTVTISKNGRVLE
ncbi:4Fe-4S binding protein [Ruminococcus sp. OA3]|uniref:ATP-binding protein n=1 Tax=Ruminococcus sp. OA3 TaxID=2914164 RepID=UPI001F0552AD|nr:4Fe-4S binding protein [Ruminococcus sp. OA3]MCH1982687.1 4Fe-4S binding protein [Ruminococcus sp. OA3]